MPRSTKGRQKVAMEKMQSQSNLQVTFSKRRSGLFKKASELCTLCGAEMVLIVFSPGDKVFSFGHPCVETVVNRFLSNSNAPPVDSTGTEAFIEARRNAGIRDLNARLEHVERALEAEKKRGEMLDQIRKGSRGRNWWEGPVEDLSLQQLEELKGAMENLKVKVSQQKQKLIVEEASNIFPGAINGGASSSLGGGVYQFGANSSSMTMPSQGLLNRGYGRGFY